MVMGEGVRIGIWEVVWLLRREIGDMRGMRLNGLIEVRAPCIGVEGSNMLSYGTVWLV